MTRILLAESAPGIGVVILALPQRLIRHRALRRGALGAVARLSDAVELLHAVGAAARGRPRIGASLSGDPIDVWMARGRRADVDSYDTLTSRKREILQRVERATAARPSPGAWSSARAPSRLTGPT
jgi:DNA-binding NarL/FixJ family response regulator